MAGGTFSSLVVDVVVVVVEEGVEVDEDEEDRGAEAGRNLVLVARPSSVLEVVVLTKGFTFTGVVELAKGAVLGWKVEVLFERGAALGWNVAVLLARGATLGVTVAMVLSGKGFDSAK